MNSKKEEAKLESLVILRNMIASFKEHIAAIEVLIEEAEFEIENKVVDEKHILDQLADFAESDDGFRVVEVTPDKDGNASVDFEELMK